MEIHLEKNKALSSECRKLLTQVLINDFFDLALTCDLDNDMIIFFLSDKEDQNGKK